MQFLCFCVLLSLNVFGAQALFGGDAWNDLKVTWGINPFGSNNYVSLPRTQAEAIKKGWTMESDCSTGNGIRYVLKGDRAVILIFTAAGSIAGIACSVPKNMPYNFPPSNVQHMFDDEGDSWRITAYFTEPSSVCSGARLSTGDRLVFKSEKFEKSVALEESKVDKTFWTEGRCFYTMGVHYWADVSQKELGLTTNPDNFVPIFLQYNSGKLNGFGWAFNADLKSTRYEHPTTGVLGSFFKQVPEFFSDKSKVDIISTMHIYLDSTPTFNFC